MIELLMVYLVESSILPLSIIIIGIGNSIFWKIERLDDDNEQLINSNGIKAQRNLVQFVAFSKYENMPHRFIQEVHAEVIIYWIL